MVASAVAAAVAAAVASAVALAVASAAVSDSCSNWEPFGVVFVGAACSSAVEVRAVVGFFGSSPSACAVVLVFFDDKLGPASVFVESRERVVVVVVVVKDEDEDDVVALPEVVALLVDAVLDVEFLEDDVAFLVSGGKEASGPMILAS